MQQKKILLVDDDMLVLRTIGMKLSANGYAVVTAADGSAAVTAVRRDPPDLILLDITYPPDVAHGGGVPWDGFLVMTWLHHMNEAKGIPVIMITGGDIARYKARARAAGAACLFHKSVDAASLLAAIQRALDKTAPPHPCWDEPPQTTDSQLVKGANDAPDSNRPDPPKLRMMSGD